MGFVLTLAYIAVLYLTPQALLPSLAPYRMQLWLGLAALACSVPAVLTDRRWRAPQLVLFAALVVWIPTSLILGPAHYVGGALESIYEFVPNAIVLLLVVINCRSVRRLRILLSVLVIVAGYFVFRGAESYYAGDAGSAFVLNQHVGDDDGPGSRIFRIRGLGTLNDPNDFAQYLIVLMPFIWLGWRRGRRVRQFVIAAPVTALFAWGLFLTHSRGAMVGLALVLLFAFRRKLGTTRAAILAACLVACLLAINFSGGRQVSVEGGADRLDLWSEGLQMFKSSPVFGIGYNQFSDKAGLTAHNSFVLCLTELGLVGYFFWLSTVVFTLFHLQDVIGPKPGFRIEDDSGAEDAVSVTTEAERITRFALIARLSLIGFLATSWFLSRAYSATCWLVLGVAIATVQLGRTAENSSSNRGIKFLLRWSAVAEFASVTLVYVMLRAANLSR